MIADSDIPIVWEDPQLSWDRPNASNMSRIVQRFLKTVCSFLILLDNDQVPYNDLVDIVKADKDVVSCPTVTRKNGLHEWMAYRFESNAYEWNLNGYKSIDLDALEDPPDFLEVDTIGGGCLIIKRRVLTEIKDPFVDVFNQYGVRIRGCDLEFGRKVKEHGFGLYVTPKKRCEHYKCLGVSRYAGM
jgi:GT2 family glycosyltransferase